MAHMGKAIPLGSPNRYPRQLQVCPRSRSGEWQSHPPNSLPDPDLKTSTTRTVLSGAGGHQRSHFTHEETKHIQVDKRGPCPTGLSGNLNPGLSGLSLCPPQDAILLSTGQMWEPACQPLWVALVQPGPEHTWPVFTKTATLELYLLSFAQGRTQVNTR